MGEGAEHVEVFGDGVQQPLELLGGAMDLLQGDDRVRARRRGDEGAEEAKLGKPSARPMVVKCTSIPGDEVHRRARREPRGHEATQTTGHSQPKVQGELELGSSRGPCRDRHQPERQQGGAT